MRIDVGRRSGDLLVLSNLGPNLKAITLQDGYYATG